MAALTIQQRKSLASYLRTWRIATEGQVEVDDSATERFCTMLLQDRPWSDMWAFDDVKALIEGVRVAGLQSATEQSLVVPDLLRKEFERRLQAELESYPKDYFVYVELPGLSPSRLDEEMLVLSNQIALVRTSMPLEKIERLVRPGFPVGFENLLGNATSFDDALEALRPISSVLLEQDSVYLRVTESGALPDIFFGEEPAFLPRALTFVKIVVFYGLEIGLFERREIFRNRHHDPGRRTIAHIAIHSKHGHEQRSENMPRDFENFLRGITFY